MSLFQEVHTQIRRSGNILTIGFLEREEKMTSRCDVSSSTRGNESCAPGLPLTQAHSIGSGCDTAAHRKQAAPRVSAGSTGPIFTGCVPDLSHPHHSFQQEHAPQLKKQEAGSWGTSILCFPDWRTLHSLGEILQLKTEQFIPFKWGDPHRASKEKVQNFKGWSHVHSHPSLGRKIFKRISPETSWRWKGNALGKTIQPDLLWHFYKRN